jgi:enoyl-CoA hydratase
MDLEFCEAVEHALEEVAGGPARALVLTGTGKTFSAGVDLRAAQKGGDYLRRFLPAMESLFRAVLTFPKPVVAAVNGHAIAGGCIIAAACDRAVMADGTGTIGVPELAVGVPFPVLPFEIVRARVAPAVFRSLVLDAVLLTPLDARNAGLVDALSAPDSLLDDAVKTATGLASIAASTFTLTKRALVEPILQRVSAAAPLDADICAAWEGRDVQVALAAYIERTLNRGR